MEQLDLDNTKSSNSSPEDTDAEIGNEKPKRLSKTEKKLKRYQRKIASYKLKKLEKKKLRQAAKETDDNKLPEPTEPKSESNELAKTENTYDNYINKRELKRITNERMKQVLDSSGTNSLKICIDCSFSDIMSDKEQSRLAQQIGRCYASNKGLNQPVYLTLCNLKSDSKFYQECCRVNDGFAKYIMNTTDKSIEDYYTDTSNTIAYLSPDSTTYLESIDANKTYVIGGLVDETVSKKVTISKCDKLQINTYSLPIEKYMTRKVFLNGEIDAKTYNYNKILAINQVFDILSNYYSTNDWCKSLEIGVPKRKGFIIGQSDDNNLNKTDSD